MCPLFRSSTVWQIQYDNKNFTTYCTLVCMHRWSSKIQNDQDVVCMHSHVTDSNPLEDVTLPSSDGLSMQISILAPEVVGD